MRGVHQYFVIIVEMPVTKKFKRYIFHRDELGNKVQSVITRSVGVFLGRQDLHLRLGPRAARLQFLDVLLECPRRENKTFKIS